MIYITQKVNLTLCLRQFLFEAMCSGSSLYLVIFIHVIFPSSLLSSSTRKRFYSQRPSGQTGHMCFLLSPPIRTFLFMAQRVQHFQSSVFHACRFSSIFSISPSRAFRSSFLTPEIVPTSTSMPAERLEPASLTLVRTIVHLLLHHGRPQCRLNSASFRYSAVEIAWHDLNPTY